MVSVQTGHWKYLLGLSHKTLRNPDLNKHLIRNRWFQGGHKDIILKGHVFIPFFYYSDLNYKCW